MPLVPSQRGKAGRCLALPEAKKPNWFHRLLGQDQVLQSVATLRTQQAIGFETVGRHLDEISHRCDGLVEEQVAQQLVMLRGQQYARRVTFKSVRGILTHLASALPGSDRESWSEAGVGALAGYLSQVRLVVHFRATLYTANTQSSGRINSSQLQRAPTEACGSSKLQF